MSLAGMKTILAIDQSTSGTKAVLFDTQGNVLARAAREHKQIYPRPGWVEHNPEEIWENTVYVSQELKVTTPEAFKELLCISITNQRETVVVFERGTGRPLYNALVWQCRRGQAICERLNQAGYSEILRKKQV